MMSYVVDLKSGDQFDFTQNLQRAMDVPALGRHHMWQVPEGFSLPTVTPDI
jgi:hypothetical protein